MQRVARGALLEVHLLHVGAQRLENAAHIGILQREAELNPQEAETHVPDLPERKPRSLVHGGESLRGAGAAAQMR